MLCEICNEREANVVFTEVINGKVTEHNLCMECARKSNFGQQNYAALIDGGSHLGRLLSGLLGMALNNNGEDVSADGQNVICPVCKTSYKDFVSRSRFGCADCYDVFELLMEDRIKNLQGSTTHTGKRPMKAKSRVEKTETQINDLSAEDLQLLRELFGDKETEVSEQAVINATTEPAAREQAVNNVAAQAKAGMKPDPEASVQTDAGMKNNPAANAQTDSGMKSDPEASVQANAQTDSGMKSDPEASVQANAQTDSGMKSDPEASTQAEAGTKAQTQAEITARTRKQIALMKNQLKKALEEENYKNAAHLRDQIHALEDFLQEGGVL